MKFELVVFMLIGGLLVGCTTVSPQSAEFKDQKAKKCLCRELANGAMLTLTSDDDEWLCVSGDSVAYGFVGEKTAKLKLAHEACESDRGCLLNRTGGGRSGRFYLWRKSDREIEFGRLDDKNAFPPIDFNNKMSNEK